MLHSPPPTGTAAAPADPPAPQAASPPSAGKRRGNPDLNLALRCGARTRAGCPCRAPAIRGKRRCRMHGGRSTGPRTQEGRARIAAARTRYSPAWRARAHYLRSFTGRGRVFRAARQHLDRLPPDLVARFRQGPPELRTPPYPAGGITPAEDRAMQRAEAEALASWKAAIALARQAARGRRGVAEGQRGAAPAEAHAPVALPRDPAAPRAVQADVAVKAHAPERARDPAAAAVAPCAASSAAQAKAHAPGRGTGGAAIPAASPPAPAERQAKAHAPEAADARALVPHVTPAAAQAKAHAPEQARAAEGASPASLSNRAARRWLRKQERLRQKRASRSRR